jgi:hypothetical protein
MMEATRQTVARLTWPSPNQAMAMCALVLAAAVLCTHAGKYPHFAGFWAGVDQQRYLEAARAWSVLDLSPSRHHYLPLYPLMAAPFVWLTPWQPFMVPDLLCLLVSLLLFVRIGARLAPGWPGSVAALCFVLAVMGSKTLLGLWIVPWSSTGSAPFQFAAVLLALRFGERPGADRAGALGLAIAMIAGVRPSDAAVLLATCGPYAAVALLRRRACPRHWMAVLATGGGACAAGILGIFLLHSFIYGLSPSPYIAESASIGFEWRLLPIRWVMLAIDPRPLLPEGSGMVVHLPWLIPGIAGLLLATVPRRGASTAPAWLAAATVVVHWAAYLAYRDMHAYGLWRFTNIHYFKWTFPFLVLWAVQFAVAIIGKRSRAGACVALAFAMLLFTWRPILRKPAEIPLQLWNGAISLPRAPRTDEALLLPIAGDSPQLWTTIYFAPTHLDVAGRDYITKRDTKLLPVPGGALLIALRQLPDGPAALSLPPEILIDTKQPAHLFRQAIVLGVPCAVLRQRRSCKW